MKTFLILLLLGFGIILSNNCIGATCTTTAPGVWDCGTPAANDILIVNHDVSLGAWVSSGNITVNTGATLTFTAKFEATGSAIVTVDGTINVSGETKLLNTASLVVNGTMNATKITMENNSSATISGTLTMTSDLELKVTSSMTIEDGGSLSASKFIMNSGTSLIMESNSDASFSNTVDIKAGASATVDGSFSTTADLKLNGSICGSGSVTYDPADGCSGAGTACGDSGWCDGSGSITSGTLPVELIAFNGKSVEGRIELTWETQSEINNNYFTVEKLDKRNTFQEILKISGAGNSDTPKHYIVFDSQPTQGLSYYRLKQTDFDGKYEYLKIIAVQIIDHNNNTFEIFPNPISNGFFNIKYFGNKQPASVFLSDLKGKVIMHAKIPSFEGMTTEVIEIPQSISPGLYLVTLNQSGLTSSQTVVIK